LVLAVATRLRHQPPPVRQAIRQPVQPTAPKEFSHPFIPSPQVVKPAVAPCRARDLHDLVGAVRQTQKKLTPALKKGKDEGAPAACRAEADNRRWSAMVDVFSRDAQSCVAKDSELDSQWNQVQSAVVALDGCVDCTRPRGARTTSCQRTKELLDAADKATP
jgi:small-conductance mechanosensitive channel